MGTKRLVCDDVMTQSGGLRLSVFAQACYNGLALCSLLVSCKSEEEAAECCSINQRLRVSWSFLEMRVSKFKKRK